MFHLLSPKHAEPGTVSRREANSSRSIIPPELELEPTGCHPNKSDVPRGLSHILKWAEANARKAKRQELKLKKSTWSPWSHSTFAILLLYSDLRMTLAPPTNTTYISLNRFTHPSARRMKKTRDCDRCRWSWKGCSRLGWRYLDRMKSNLATLKLSQLADTLCGH